MAPTLADRDTCLCKRHCNIKLIADKLHREGVIPSSSQSEQYNHLVCDKASKNCMYGTCDNCKDNRLPPISPEDDRKDVTYAQWVTKEKEFTKGTGGAQETKRAKVTVKESREITIGELYEKFETELKPRFTTHTFNIGHQYRTLRSLKELMSADEVTVHIDFSENYTCRSLLRRNPERPFRRIAQASIATHRSVLHNKGNDVVLLDIRLHAT